MPSSSWNMDLHRAHHRDRTMVYISKFPCCSYGTSSSPSPSPACRSPFAPIPSCLAADSASARMRFKRRMSWAGVFWRNIPGKDSASRRIFAQRSCTQIQSTEAQVHTRTRTRTTMSLSAHQQRATCATCACQETLSRTRARPLPLRRDVMR